MRNPDHREAATLLRRAIPGGDDAANNFERLVGIKDKAHYSFIQFARGTLRG